MFGSLWKFITRSEPSPEPVKAEEPEFTTQREVDGLDFEDTRARILHNLEATHKAALAKIRIYDAEAQTSVAMDSAEVPDGLKGIFQFGQAGVPNVQLGWYASQGFIGYQVCALIAQQWLVNKACLVPARDAVRKGWEINVPEVDGLDAVEVLAMIETADKKYRLRKNLIEFVKMGRVFGIRVVMFKVNSTDPDYYAKPFNADGITPNSYRGMVQIDPYWLAPELSTAGAMDPTSTEFYEPTYWIVNSQRVHRSHLVIMRGPEVPDLLKPSYLYGGMSVPQLIFERVYAAERCANESPQLLLTKRSTTFYTDAAKAVANPSKFAAQMEVWAGYRDNFGIKVADKMDDEIEQQDTSLADLDATIMTQYQLVAAAANIPATKLLGTTPKGFNSTGEYEEANYHEELEAIQAEDLLPLMERHHLCVLRSDVLPKLNNVRPFMVEVVFNPLDSLTAEEQATVNKTKAETDAILVGVGAIDGNDVRNRIAADKYSGHDGLEVLVPLDPLAEGTE